MKSKQMRRGLQDLAEEGVVRIFKPAIGTGWIVGVVGALQLDVLATRMEAEYGLKLGFEPSPWEIARWVSADPAQMKRLTDTHRPSLAEDADGETVLLIRNDWELNRFRQDWPEVNFAAVRERH